MKNRSAQLLISSVLRDIDEEQLRKIALDALENGLDWDVFFLTAKTNGILPLVYSSLKDCYSDLLPEYLLMDIKNAVKAIAMANLGKVSVLIQIMNLFEQHNIAAVPIKGPSLACTVYNDLSLRSFGDLDILIDLDDIIFAYDLLCKSGYKPEIKLSPYQLRQLAKTEDDLSFIHSTSGVILELHWELSSRSLPHALTLDRFLPRLVDAEILNFTVRSLSNEDLLIYLCIHGSKHIWERMEWLFAVHEIVRKNRFLDWDLIGLLASQHLFETELPKKVLKIVRSDKQAGKMAESVVNMFLEPDQDSTGKKAHPRFTSWQLQCMDTNRERLRLLTVMLFNPTIEDYRRFIFPERFRYLYYICRPLRLCWEGIKQSV